MQNYSFRNVKRNSGEPSLERTPHSLRVTGIWGGGPLASFRAKKRRQGNNLLWWLSVKGTSQGAPRSSSRDLELGGGRMRVCTPRASRGGFFLCIAQHSFAASTAVPADPRICAQPLDLLSKTALCARALLGLQFCSAFQRTLVGVVRMSL